MSLPALPQLRTFVDSNVSVSLKEIRDFLAAIKNIRLLSGKEVTITFTSADVAGSVIKRVITGLGFTPTGYFIINGHTSADLQQQSIPTTETDNTVIFLKASVAGTYKLWVF